MILLKPSSIVVILILVPKRSFKIDRYFCFAMPLFGAFEAMEAKDFEKH